MGFASPICAGDEGVSGIGAFGEEASDGLADPKNEAKGIIRLNLPVGALSISFSLMSVGMAAVPCFPKGGKGRNALSTDRA